MTSRLRHLVWSGALVVFLAAAASLVFSYIVLSFDPGSWGSPFEQVLLG
jgi:hypothetical protein